MQLAGRSVDVRSHDDQSGTGRSVAIETDRRHARATHQGLDEGGRALKRVHGPLDHPFDHFIGKAVQLGVAGCH